MSSTNCTITEQCCGWHRRRHSRPRGVSTATVLISGNPISGNHAPAGGAISAAGRAPGFVTISDNTISGNTATQQGGAIYLALSNTVKATVSQSMISGNTSAQQGGALFTSAASAICRLSTCTSSDTFEHVRQPSLSRGGGIYRTASDIAISGSTISGNSAAAGGGVYSQNGELAVNFSTIQSNTASSGNGGGISQQPRPTERDRQHDLRQHRKRPRTPRRSTAVDCRHPTCTSAQVTFSTRSSPATRSAQYGGGLYASSGIDAGVGSTIDARQRHHRRQLRRLAAAGVDIHHGRPDLGGSLARHRWIN